MKMDSIKKKVLECLSENYAVGGSLERLTGENLNYLLTTGGGEKYVVKIVDQDMPPEVVEMEFEANEYAVSNGFLPEIPKTVQNLYGKIETGIKIRKSSENRLRLLTFIEGNFLEYQPDISGVLLKNLGKSIAGYDLAMQGFDHPAAHRSHRWDLVETAQHRGSIELLEDPDKRGLLEWGFDVFEQVESALESLPWQFIHGDMNRANIMIRGEEVSGILDFGDSCFNPTVCELAICLAYIMMERDDPLETAATVTKAYNEVLPLSEEELAVLLPLVCGRLAMTIAVSLSRREIDPDNPNWFDSEESAWTLLNTLHGY